MTATAETKTSPAASEATWRPPVFQASPRRRPDPPYANAGR